MRFAVFVFLIAFLIAFIVPVSALDDWNYYRQITITNNVTQNLTDYQVSFTLDTANLIAQGKMRSDCGDLRVTLSDGQTLLPYWFDPTTCNTNYTTIWTKVPSIPASGSVTIQVWYGNPQASSVADGEAVFEFFDDFSETSLNTTKWTIVDSSAGTSTVDNGILTIAVVGLNWKTYVIKSNMRIPDLHEVIAKVKWTHTNGDRTYGILDNFSDISNYQLVGYQIGLQRYILRTKISGTIYDTIYSLSNRNPTTFELWKIRYDGTSLSAHRSTDNGTTWTQLASKSTNIFTTNFTAGIFVAVSSPYIDYFYVDYIIAKKSAASEPSVSISSEIPRPDLTIISVDYSPKPAIAKQQVNISAQIINIGGGPSQITNVTLYINENAVDTAQISGLNQNQTTLVTLAWIPNAIGSYVATIVIDPDNKIEEKNKNNNNYNLTIDVIILPDLTVNIATPLVGLTNKEITFDIIVKNVGGFPAYNFNVLVYLDSTKIDEKRITSLDPNRQITFSYSFTPYDVRTYTITAVVDSENSVVESREDNNGANVSIKILGYAVPTPTPPKPEGKSIKEIFEDLTLKTYNLPLEVISLIALLGIAVVGYGFGAFKGTVNLFFLSVLYYIAANALGWSTYIATGLLVVSAILLVIVVAFLKED